MALHGLITSEIVERVGDILSTHLMHTPEQVAGIIEHDPRIAAFADELRNEISHASVALREGFCVVVIALSLVLKHVLQMGYQFSVVPCRDRWLMHMQGTSKP